MRILLIITVFFILLSCKKKEDKDPLKEYTYGGTVWVGDSASAIIGTKWVLYQYMSTQTAPQPRTDTLEFINGTTYKYNTQSSTYNLYVAGGAYNLVLNQTPFGNLSGSGIPANFISYGEVIDKYFSDITPGSSGGYRLWLRKL